MGSGAKKHVEHFAVSPAGGAGATAVAGTDEAELLELPDELQAAIDELEAIDLTESEDPEAGYHDLFAAVAAAQEQLAAEADGLVPAAVEAADQQIKQISRAHLEALEEADLQALAGELGFTHPTLVGFSDSSSHPLIHWLDPAYADDLPSKAGIQAKATERFAALAAGETIDGIDYESVLAAEAALGLSGPPTTTWTATPAQVSAATAALHAALGELPGSLYGSEGANQVAELVAAESRLAAADCSELGDSLHKLQASAAHLVYQRLGQTTGLRSAVKHATEQWVAEGQLSAEQAELLNHRQVLALARASSDDEERATLVELAATRAEQAEVLAAARDEFRKHLDETGAVTLPDLDGSEAASAALEGFREQTAAYLQAQQAVGTWTATGSWADRPLAPPPYAPSSADQPETEASATTTAFRAWAKAQPLSELRALAAAAGLDDEHTAATRADVQNFLAAAWDPAQQTAAIQTKVDNQTAAKLAAQAGDGAAAPTGTTGPASGTTSGWTTAGTASVPTSFTGKLSVLTDKLKAHRAAAADVPEPLDRSAVEGHDWGPGQAFTGGGAHTKTVHAGPDGHQWLFKPDATGGARATAEATAARVFRAVGVPGVGVHVTDIEGTTGAVQPLVAGAAHISGAPESWTQPQVDAMVALHVAAWAVGDHDGHTGNVLSTPSGGLMACDQGQAFKFYGSDTLEVGWKPGSNPKPPVYQQAYRAHAEGELAAGVHVSARAALPTIKAFEALPDGQYRAMLKPVARKGVQAGLPWVGAMRARAKKTLGKPQVSEAEIAEAFLDAAVERKQGLREAFAGLFGQLDLPDADHLRWVG